MSLPCSRGGGAAACRCRRPPPAALLLLALAAAWLPAAHAADDGPQPSSQLPPAVLHRLLYEEPNAYLRALGNISDAEGSLSRIFLSPAHRRAAGRLRRWMAAAGMKTWADQVANVHGMVAGADPHAPELWLGSHYDTVHDGGAYDGALGIVAGICAVKALLLEAALARGLVSPTDLDAALATAAASAGAAAGGPEHDGSLDLAALLPDPAQAAGLLAAPVRVVAFSDEEGVRFHSTYLGSRALVGTLLDSGVLGNTDAGGESVSQALERAGFDPSPDSLRAAAVPRDKVRAYVEVHLEQGPVLEAGGRRLGLVTAIAGQSRLQAEIVGEQGHAGTVPMALRRDPLAAAAEVIGLLEQICNGGARGQPFNHMLASDASLVCTVGSVSVWPNAGNVIPGHTNFTLDIRSRRDDSRKQVVGDIERVLQSVCARRKLACRLRLKNEAAAVEASPQVVQDLEAAAAAAQPMVAALLEQQRRQEAESLGPVGTCAAPAGDSGSGGGGGAKQTCAAPPEASSSSSGSSSSGGGREAAAEGAAADGSPPPRLVSGAGHDAMVLAEAGIPMGMLFVRCRGGISHAPGEHVAADDVAAATATLHAYLRAQLLPAAAAKA